MIFRDNWLKTTGLDCFTRSITLAMATMEAFKANYLKQNQIAIIPLQGYQPLRKASYLGQSWLDFIEKKRGIEIKREFKLRNYYADGFIERTKEVFEFYGCYFHGCKSCYPIKRSYILNKVTNNDMEYLYNRTMEKEEYYKREGMILTTLWECQLNASLRSSKEMKSFFTENLRKLKNRKFFPPIEPRRALYGGRVNASKLYHEVDPDEKLFYYDFTSLYPYCNKVKHYPLGHPEIIRNPGKNDITDYEGLIFCKVLPPQNLYYAVLPMHINDQILYTLCYKCAYDKNKDECLHSEEERMLISTWVSVELKLAINKGYRIIDIYEIWHFDTISGGEQNNYHGVFTDFINDCIKVKVEASDYPRNYMTLEEKHEYIRMYKEHENINLDLASIENNSGKRSVSKLQVNSFWGKYAQNCHLMKKTVFIEDSDQFFKLLSDTSITVDDAFPISEEFIQVKYSKKDYFKEESPHSNVVIAAYVTAHARCELYNLLDRLGERCIYFDTDSVIFRFKVNDWKPQTGIFLGQLTDEIKNDKEPNNFIRKFVSLGAKNYAYEVYNPDNNTSVCICKCKGLTLNFKTASYVNFGTMKQLLEEFVATQNRTIINVPQFNIRTTNKYDVLSQNTNKIYRITYDRRVLRPDLTTRPFGYREPL